MTTIGYGTRKNIPVIAETEVPVIGAGPGGVSAAVMSARNGAKTLIVDLLMGCRAISLDHALHSSARIIAPVCSIGQAAGMAASMCVKQDCAPAELDGADVRKHLSDAGAWL